MKKAGLMSTVGAVLGSVETIAGEATRAISILSSYNTNWHEERQVTLAESRHERAHRWAKLGAEIRMHELNIEDVKLAMQMYKEGE